MSAKYLCIIACILLYQIFTVNGQMCPSGNNATTCAGCSDVCGASVQTSPSCCTTTNLASIKLSLDVYTTMGSSSLCRAYMASESCAQCSPASASLQICKSLCQKISTECENVFTKAFGKSRDCSAYPETNCFNSGVMNQVSAVAMICLSVILAVFAL